MAAKKLSKKVTKKAVKKTKSKKTKSKKIKSTLKLVTETSKQEVCCAGCKVDGFIKELLTSDHENDRELGEMFQEALDEFNYRQEMKNQPEYVPC
jgi:hypothetical protein